MIRLFFLIFLLISVFPSNLWSQKKPLYTTIHFPEFSIKILDYEIEPEDQKLLLLNKKSAITIASIPGETPEGRLIKIEGNDIQNLKLASYYQTAIYVTDDGVSCDLSYWKHYTTPPKTLSRFKSGLYQYPKLNIAQRSLFIPIGIESVKKEVKDNCGDIYYQLIKNKTSIHQPPFTVDVYRYVLKLSGKVKSTGKAFSKQVIFDLPLD